MLFRSHWLDRVRVNLSGLEMAAVVIGPDADRLRSYPFVLTSMLPSPAYVCS